jgi:hypothetical protein
MIKTYLRCKACGYIAVEQSITDRCPACGVPRTALESYRNPVSDGREAWLKLDVHPVLVHFPQAFVFTLFILLAASFGVAGSARETILSAATVLIYALPFVVFGGFTSGLADGKVRFKKLRTPALTKKVILGIIALLLSAALLIVYRQWGFDRLFLLLCLAALLSAVSVALGRIGSRIVGAKMPG